MVSPSHVLSPGHAEVWVSRMASPGRPPQASCTPKAAGGSGVGPGQAQEQPGAGPYSPVLGGWQVFTWLSPVWGILDAWLVL